MATESTSPVAYHKTGFTVNDLPDLKGKVAIVTGGNTGLGFETSLQLATKGARVFIACRNPERAANAITDIKKQTGKDVEALQLDLQDIKQVKKAAEEFLKLGLPLHILPFCLGNALWVVDKTGIMACPFALTKDGIESQLGTNHVGHYVFTTTLLPAIEKAGHGARIVNVSSYGHRLAPANGIDFDNINKDVTSIWARYGQSKLANILFTRELNRRYGDKGIFCNAIHPGVVQTELLRGPKESYGISSWFFFLSPIVDFVEWTFSLTPKDGALTQIYCAASNKIVEENIRGEYLIPFGKVDLGSAHSRDPELAKKLWEWTEKTVAERFASK
eukprot:jgi/Hompol1/2220/HPOL_005891-RA